MPRLEPRDVQFFSSIDELRAWLEANGETADELWVGSHKTTKERRPAFSWAEMVDELLAHGWIDSVRMPYTEGTHAQRVTPRRPGSIWSKRNVDRVEALRAEGRMRPAGEAAFAKRTDNKTAIYSFERELAFDEAAEAKLRADADGWAWFQQQPPGYRRLATHFVMSAKREETRGARLAKLVDGCVGRYRLPEITGKARSG
ncbi:MAG: YdeI/OmpD-associated family protein [Candidatus Eisenbacteria bacterium]